MSVKIDFLGAAGTVTGSKYLLSFADKKILIDCGLFQGIKNLRQQNWDKLPVSPSEIDALLLTHAHIDHSGYIPRLIKDGFSGKIYSTSATKDLCAILLPDCGYLQEEEAGYLNRRKRSKHQPALPLFTQKEGADSIAYFETIDFHKKISLTPTCQFEFRYAGHILGAASIFLKVEGKTFFFTGDIGRAEDAILFPPAPPPEADYIITESTYGNRRHKPLDVLFELGQTIRDTHAKGGVILIPAFAVGRAQSILYYLWQLKKQKLIPDFPMYMNSPMATNVGALLRHYKPLHHLDQKSCEEMCATVKYIHTTEDSKSLNEKNGPMLIISASGMLTGGRILHHIRQYAPLPETTIILTGFQSAGTRGSTLQQGAEEIKIYGEYVPVRAQIKNLDALSAHADYIEIIKWFSTLTKKPKKVFITHGESSAADELRRRLAETYQWDCVVPYPKESFRVNI